MGSAGGFSASVPPKAKGNKRKIQPHSSSVGETELVNAPRKQKTKKIRTGLSGGGEQCVSSCVSTKQDGWKPKHPAGDLKSGRIANPKDHGKLPASLHRRRAKRAVLKGLKQSKTQDTSTHSSLLLRNLPPSVNYSLLQNTVPTAHRFQLFKRGSKRHAFAKFRSKEACEEAAKNLKGLTLDGYQISITFVTPKVHLEGLGDAGGDVSRCLTLANLPFSLCKKDVQEEFPTASDVIMNMNKFGRFRGSCLLVFDTVDDCKIARSACHGRVIGGRPVKYTLGVRFEAQNPKNSPVCGIKIRGLPSEVDVSQLKALFPEDVVVRAHVNVDSSKVTQTGVVVFTDRASQKAALHRFATEKLFGLRLRARPWKPTATEGSTTASEHVATAKKMKTEVYGDQKPLKAIVKKHKHGKSPSGDEHHKSKMPDIAAEYSIIKTVTTPRSVHKRKNMNLMSPDLDATSNVSTTPEHKSAKKNKRSAYESPVNADLQTVVHEDQPKPKKARASLETSFGKSPSHPNNTQESSTKKKKPKTPAIL
ncbi:nucleolin [Clonorchis sinensis]|uniref:Nucleolin n=1 Tax=Clonorchis sinensis TaxID=79923 RepID=A0A8T1M4T2_CLOSI|nr:nucleolin [Clonorchis sinensis]